MARKPPKGYFVRGQFVAYGSAEDAHWRRAAKGDVDISKTDRKKQSAYVQQLGQRLLELPAAVLRTLALQEALLQALEEARRLGDFEARRRQLQYVGRLMRSLDDAQIAAIEAALAQPHAPRAEDAARQRLAQSWCTRLLDDDDALLAWRDLEPQADWQRLRTLIRQARKDAAASAASEPTGAATSRARRELLRHLQQVLQQRAADAAAPFPIT
ncbi:hypothetical protein Talka_01820 [Tepidimonas alkaliphilus]|uniref:Ribosome-associated protein n=1 Tax=Tepidimonas alkaliphilus TaxID=2588942 RepID=A0A554W657_9BURK|nr:ribosome biogenesis factor YjgA [Tepidimonas alkaliphilus]TSE19056.1 hypothetical protein Talka_01820 [Tepidimonas alkaliphilus]